MSHFTKQMNTKSTPAEKVATLANLAAYKACQACGVELTGNTRLDKFNPHFNNFYIKEYNRLLTDFMRIELVNEIKKYRLELQKAENSIPPFTQGYLHDLRDAVYYAENDLRTFDVNNPRL